MILINPATEKFGGFLSRYVPVGIPVAVGCLAAYMIHNGIDCQVVDEEIEDFTLERLRRMAANCEKPLVVGLSCLTAHVGRAYQIGHMVKAEFPDSVVIYGGLHPTAMPDEPFDCGAADFVVRGEGEEVLLQLYRAIQGDGDPRRIGGVTYRQDGKSVHNSEAPLLPSLDEIPQFPYHLFEHPKYDRGFLTTSRGCPYRCSYCSQRLLTGSTYRYRSAKNIIRDITLLVEKYGQKAIVFYDDNFCLNAKRVHELCDDLIASGLHKRVELSVQTRADNVLIHGGEELVRHMAEAGFTHMGFGLETGVQRLADLTRKDETVECHLEVSELCRRHGMAVSFFMIFGFPTETAADREHSFRVVQKAGLMATKYNNLIPYPSTPLWNEIKDCGRVVVTKDWRNFNSVLAMTSSIFDKTPLPYVPETCSEWELRRDIVRYNLKSFINWRAIAGVLGRKKALGWFMLPERWFLKPRELFEVCKIGMYVGINMLMAFLPLAVTEPLMTVWNPALGQRRRVKGYDPASYVQRDWDSGLVKAKAQKLRNAKAELEQTGHFNIFVPTEAAAAETATIKE